MSSSSQTQEAQEAKNENISVTMKRSPGSKVKLDISVTPQATIAAYNKALKQINKEVTLPGFRKGKAPDTFIKQNYAPQIEAEWREIVIQTGFQEAIGLLRLHPFKGDTIQCTSVKQVSQEHGSEFTVEFEASPTVPAVQLNDLVLKNVERRAISQNEINEVLDNLALRCAEWIPITDRPVEDGDFVDLDIERLDEPKEIICQDTRFAVLDKKMAPWMRNLLVGHNVNETVEGLSEKDPTSTSEEFQPTRCRLTIKRIHQATLPKTPDEIAQRLGLKTGEELIEYITADLNLQANRAVQDSLRQQVDEWLLANYQFDLPATLVNEEKELRIHETVDNLHQQKVPESQIEKRKQDLEPIISAQVERTYRLYFLILAFAKQHNLNVTKEEVASELTQRLMAAPGNAQLPQNIDALRSRITQQLLMQKTRDYIIDHVKRA